VHRLVAPCSAQLGSGHVVGRAASRDDINPTSSKVPVTSVRNTVRNGALLTWLHEWFVPALAGLRLRGKRSRAAFSRLPALFQLSKNKAELMHWARSFCSAIKGTPSCFLITKQKAPEEATSSLFRRHFAGWHVSAGLSMQL